MTDGLLDVVMIDDENLDLELLRTSVDWASLGFRILAAFSNSITALDFLQASKHIDLLISDIQMPILSGLDLFEYALAGNPQLKAVFISGHDEFKYAKKAIDLSASGYVLKPIDYDELQAVLIRVKQSIHSSQQEQDADDLHAGLGESINAYIEKHLLEPLSLHQIAQHFNYTPNYISIQFKLFTGRPLGAYLIEKRIEKAAELLARHHMTVAEVCRMLGYSSTAYFVHLFKKIKGVTPGQYKLSHKRDIG